MRRLEHLLAGRFAWEGRVEAGTVAPGSPEMHAIGAGACRPLFGGLWLSCELEQEQYLEGNPVLDWKAHLVIGWDTPSQRYRAFEFDTAGGVLSLEGTMRQDVLVLSGRREDGSHVRMSFDFTQPHCVGWTTHASLDGKSWSLTEKYQCTRTGQPTCVTSADPLIPW
jgi:hypothetical protein